MKKLLFLLLFVLSIFSISCKKKEERKKILKTAFFYDVQTLDPRKSGDYSSSQPIFMIYRGLMHFNSKNKLVPALAKSYVVSEDKKTYTFYLKEAKWSDGHQVTAYDFEKSLKRCLEPTFPSYVSQLLYPIKNAKNAKQNLCSVDDVKVKALNDKTLIFELENPTPYFLFLTSFFAYFPVPSHIDEKELFSKDTEIVCSGAFKLKKWKKNDELIFEKNPFFYDKDKIMLDEIQMNIIPNEDTALNMYERGELNFISSFLSPIAVDSLGKIQKRKDINLRPIGGMSFLTFNTGKFPFTNKNIRKAFSLAVDREKIVKNISQLNEKIATRCIPPILINGKNRNILENNNVKLANTYLERGLKELNVSRKDLKIKFLYGSYVLHKKEAEAIAQMLEKALNIKVILEQTEAKTLLAKLSTHQYQMGLGRLIVHYNDPMNIFERFKFKNESKNYPYWENKEFISLLDKANSEINLKKREKILEDAELVLINDLPIAPLYFYNYLMLQKPYVKGVYINTVGDLFFDETHITKREEYEF